MRRALDEQPMMIDDDNISALEDQFEGKGELIVSGREDCLYLNIFRPKTTARKLPVYVFIHGGANMMGGITAFDGSYRFDWCGPEPFNFALGAAHGTEMPFFFGDDRGLYNAWTPEADTSGRKELRDIMMTYVANFAATGNPNGENVPVWQQWSNDDSGPKVVLLDADDDQATIEMSSEEINIRDVKTELRDEIAQWPPMKQVRYGMVPYIFPLAMLQLLPEQIVIDRGIFGEYVWDAGFLMRKLILSPMPFANMNAEQP